VFTSFVAVDLDRVGLIRTAYLDLGDEVTSSDDASQAAQSFIDEHSVMPSAGRVTVSRPIYDRDLCRMVEPWELVRHGPGSLIRVRGVDADVDAIGTASRDGVSVFRVKAAEYDSDKAAVVLELDTFPTTLQRSVARLQSATDSRR
jgi:hypothetical protein